MTQKETAEILKNMKLYMQIDDLKSDYKFPQYAFDAMDNAIKSLEAWELVKDELKNDYIGLPAYDSGICHALKIIDKHLSEVSECR